MSVPLLTLDENTLLCWTLGDSKKRKLSDVVNKWAVAIPGDAKPPALNHVTVSPIREHKSKKARREALPNHVTPKWFRYTFVSTYIDFVGQTANPWKVPGKAVEVMQRIWDATCACEYRITASTAVYQKTLQYCSESWRDVIGSVGITSVIAYLDAEELSDGERQEFCMTLLEGSRFLCNTFYPENSGEFRSPLFLQTFAAHLRATKGAQKTLGLHGPDKATPAAIGALGLVAASVERALTLVATGTLTIEMARGKAFNLSSGKKKSTRETGFSDSAWGKASRGYASRARELPKAVFDAIVEETWVHYGNLLD